MASTTSSPVKTGTHRLDALLNARSVAVVGASADPGKITGRPIAYMRARGYTGEIYPVNPGRTEVQGLPCFASIAASRLPRMATPSRLRCFWALRAIRCRILT